MTKLRKILHVEDNVTLQLITKIALEVFGGFEVLQCISGEEALEKASEFSPDLLLLDVMMPEMDGPTTLIKLRDLPDISKVPAIFLTAKSNTDDCQFLRELSGNEVICKPFDPQKLASQIDTIWMESQAATVADGVGLSPRLRPELNAV